jgi:hypothetical protein
MGEEDPITLLIKLAVGAPDGHLRLANAQEFIMGELERNRFNTERAIEVYTVAIDNSVWAFVKDMPLQKLMFSEYLRSGLGKKHAIELTEKFKKGSGAFAALEDQRPPRRFLRFLLGA